jgi:hypothetical protein
MKEYAIYDMEDYEQCVYLGTINEIAKFLNCPADSIRSYISRRKLGKNLGYIQKRYDVIKIDEEEIEEKPKKTMQEIWKELLEAFTPEKHNFIEYDPFKDELKRRMNMIIVNEEWKQIKDTHYSISNYGRVRNDNTSKFKEPRFHKWIYRVDIYENGKRHTLDIKKLVAHYFIKELKRGDEVRYIDGDARNNYYKNLKIVCK